MTVHWIELSLLLEIHDLQIEKHGGSPGVKDLGLIESALARPENKAAYGDPDAAELAAAYAFGLCKNHGFNDGNKRVGWMAARMFLAMNHFIIVVPDQEAIGLMLKVTCPRQFPPV